MNSRAAGLALIFAGLALVLLLSISVGARPIPVDLVWDLVWHPDGSDDAIIVHDLRIPRTILGLIVGAALGVGGGLVAGIALGFSVTLRRAAFLTVEMLRPIPSVALLPLSLLIFGFGYRMEVAVIAFATFWPAPADWTTGAVIATEVRDRFWPVM